MRKQLAELMERHLEALDYLMDGLEFGRVSVDDWQQSFATDLMVFHTAAYMQAAGIKDSADVSEAAQQALTALLKEQIDYLNAFADAIDETGVSDETIARYRARAKMYTGALKTSWSMGETRLLDLPAHPGQGSECMVNCLCSWQIVEVDAAAGDFDCYWERVADDSCSTCIQREQDWSPYRVRNWKGETA